jgi:hypothetical protein
MRAPPTAFVTLPNHWFDAPEMLDDLESIAKALQPAGRQPGYSAPTRLADPDGSLQRAVDSARGGHVSLCYPSDAPVAHAVASMALWLGAGSVPVHDILGGTVSVVQSGVGHRHDQAWHTDSTPWFYPNRWTLLGQLTQSPGVEQPQTEILAVSDLLATLRTEQRAALMKPIPWRRNFADLPEMLEPILGTPAFRWVNPVVDELYSEFDEDVVDAVCAFRSSLSAVRPKAATLCPGKLLLIDNHASLHRGPPLEADSARTLVRIKVGGRPLR